MEETKVLGVIFDRRLSFAPHLKYVKKKGSKALNILKVMGNTEWRAAQKVMLHLYRSLVRSDTVFSMRLPDSASIFTAESWAVIKALDSVASKYIIFTSHFCVSRLYNI